MSGTLGKNSLSVAEMSWINQKVSEIKQHPAWNDEVDEIQSERMLKTEAPFSFILRPGKDMYHYFLSFIEADGTLHHKPVKIELSVKGWLYRNGGGTIREKLVDLIPAAIHCLPEQCKPYRGLKTVLFFD